MKIRNFYRNMAAGLLILSFLFAGNMVRVYGEEAEPGALFTDGSEIENEKKPDEEEINSGIQEPSGGYIGYPASGGGSAPRETIIRKPQLFLSSTSFDDSDMEAGESVPISAAFVNKSIKQSIYNLKITLGTEAGSLNFSPNSFYFSKVSPGQEIHIDTIVKNTLDITETSVPVNFNFEYEDIKGTAASGSENRSFSIKQPIKMELCVSEFPTYLFASDTAEVTLGALNLSRTTAYNVRICLKGTGLFPQEEIFIGNMEPGTKKEGSMRLYVGTKSMKEIGVDSGESDSEKYGPVKGKIILKYEDYQGNPGKITQKYQTEIKKPQILSLNVKKEEKETNSWWISVFTVGISGLFSVVLILLWKLRRKNVLLEEARKEGFYEKT